MRVCLICPSAATHLHNSENSPQDLVQQNQVKTLLRSCIKKVPPSASVNNKKVQWVDSLGKQLVDIKEFESSEMGDTDNEEENGGCLCSIL